MQNCVILHRNFREFGISGVFFTILWEGNSALSTKLQSRNNKVFLSDML